LNNRVARYLKRASFLHNPERRKKWVFQGKKWGFPKNIPRLSLFDFGLSPENYKVKNPYGEARSNMWLPAGCCFLSLGLFGPIGVAPSHRGNGTGKALLLACLLDMKLKGYGYAVVGSVKDTDFYRKTVGAVEIPDSTPGYYRNMVRKPGPGD